ncbi:hypothetical protein [Acidithiobacillus caldus]|nr:hypothetical protein [Acidithiobacillus caldus]
MMKTSEQFTQFFIHVLIQCMVLTLLAIAGYALYDTAVSAWVNIADRMSTDTLIEGAIVHTLGTIILLETVFVLRKLDEKHHLNVGLALDVAATFLIRETVVAVYTHASTAAIFILLASVAVMVILRISLSLRKQKELAHVGFHQSPR